MRFKRASVLAISFVKQIEDVSAYLGRIGIPTLFPVAVELPRNTRAPVYMLSEPHAESCMRLRKACIGAKVDGSHHSACGQLVAMNSIVAGKRLRYFGTHFD